MPLRVQILMYDGVEEPDAIGPRDVLGPAVRAGGPVLNHSTPPRVRLAAVQD